MFRYQKMQALTDDALDVINDILYVARLRVVGSNDCVHAVLWSFEEDYALETIDRMTATC